MLTKCRRAYVWYLIWNVSVVNRNIYFNIWCRPIDQAVVNSYVSSSYTNDWLDCLLVWLDWSPVVTHASIQTGTIRILPKINFGNNDINVSILIIYLKWRWWNFGSIPFRMFVVHHKTENQIATHHIVNKYVLHRSGTQSTIE